MHVLKIAQKYYKIKRLANLINQSFIVDLLMDVSNRPEWLKDIAVTQQAVVMFTSRGMVGIGASAYADFNLCHYTGDDPSHVASCRRLLANELGIPDSSIVVPRQTHSSEVRIISLLPVDQQAITGVDALVTKLKQVAIGVSTADCVPVVAVDDETGVIGVAHAGWRGAVDGIVTAMLGAMRSQGTELSNILLFLGPAICSSCFEVGEEVAARFPQDCVVRNPAWPKPHVDLPAYVIGQAVEFGILHLRSKNLTRICVRSVILTVIFQHGFPVWNPDEISRSQCFADFLQFCSYLELL